MRAEHHIFVPLYASAQLLLVRGCTEEKSRSATGVEAYLKSVLKSTDEQVTKRIGPQLD